MKKLVLFIVFLFILSPVYAVHVRGLYQAEIPVSSQMIEAREEAVKAGLVGVLIKLTGDPDIENNPQIAPSLEKADYYVQEYSYLPSNTSSERYQIQISYEPNDIKRLLRRAAIAFWAEKRPLILVWLAYTNTQSQTEIIGNENPGNVLSVMRDQSKKLGLPIIFPMMDVLDMSKISDSEVLNNDIGALKEVGKRYAPDGLLIGHISAATDDFYTSEWKLVLGGKTWEWSLSDHSSSKLVNTLIYHVSQTLVLRYSKKNQLADQSWLKLEVTNINERDDLSILMKHLSQLTSVQKIQLAQVSGDVVHLGVLVRGSLHSFQENAMTGQKLILRSEDNENNKLIYEWVH